MLLPHLPVAVTFKGYQAVRKWPPGAHAVVLPTALVDILMRLKHVAVGVSWIVPSSELDFYPTRDDWKVALELVRDGLSGDGMFDDVAVALSTARMLVDEGS